MNIYQEKATSFLLILIYRIMDMSRKMIEENTNEE